MTTRMVYKDEETGDKLKVVQKEGRGDRGDLTKVVYKEGDRRPQSPGRKPRSPGRRSRSPGRRSRSPGRKPRSPGRKPQSPGRKPRSPGRRPRSPGKKPQPKPAHAEEAKQHPDWWWAAHGPQSEHGYHYTPYEPVHIETREYTPPAPKKEAKPWTHHHPDHEL